MALSTTQYGYIIDPMVPFTDDKGKTIKNGFVRVFVAGSSTPVVTYRNFDGAANQDLIELDNSGRTKTSVIGSKGFTYKVCVYDAFHSQESPILTVDKVSVIGANITAEAGATLVTGLDGLTTKPDGFVDASVVGTDGYVALDHTLVTDDLNTDEKVTAVENDRYVPLLNDDVNNPDSKMTLGRLWQWVLGKIKSLSTTITAFRSGDVIPVDGPLGTAKMSKDDLLRVTADNALGSIHSLSDVATEADLVADNYLVLNGSGGTKKLSSYYVANLVNSDNVIKSSISTTYSGNKFVALPSSIAEGWYRLEASAERGKVFLSLRPSNTSSGGITDVLVVEAGATSSSIVYVPETCSYVELYTANGSGASASLSILPQVSANERINEIDRKFEDLNLIESADNILSTSGTMYQGNLFIRCEMSKTSKYNLTIRTTNSAEIYLSTNLNGTTAGTIDRDVIAAKSDNDYYDSISGFSPSADVSYIELYSPNNANYIITIEKVIQQPEAVVSANERINEIDRKFEDLNLIESADNILSTSGTMYQGNLFIRCEMSKTSKYNLTIRTTNSAEIYLSTNLNGTQARTIDRDVIAAKSDNDYYDSISGFSPSADVSYIELYSPNNANYIITIEKVILQPEAVNSLTDRFGVGSYTNPLRIKNYNGSAADPTLAYENGAYYSAVTGRRLPLFKSFDLVRWFFVGYILSEAEANYLDTIYGNAGAERMWAPDLVKIGNRWHCYFTLSSSSNYIVASVCLSVASDIEGPWKLEQNVVCDNVSISVYQPIDPCVVKDADGTPYLFLGSSHNIYSFEMSADGKSIDIATKNLIATANTLEATHLVYKDGYWYLFNSAGSTNQGGNYHVTIARSTFLTGPYVNVNNEDITDGTNPPTTILSGNTTFDGPGHLGGITSDANGKWWAIFHVRFAGERQLMLQEVSWPVGEFPSFTNSGKPVYYSESPAL